MGSYGYELLKRKQAEKVMADLLEQIRVHDNDYTERYDLVMLAIGQASKLGYGVGIRFDPTSTADWPCVYIELPTGQVSWHVPKHQRAWDGHSTVDKWARMEAYRRSVEPTKQEMAAMQGEPWDLGG